MKECKICRGPIAEWETLCSKCWKRAEENYRVEKRLEEDSFVIERLRGKAKMDLMDMIRELCRQCPHQEQDIEKCNECGWKEKEKLLRAFID
jgi:uncharacterized Zn finger protein